MIFYDIDINISFTLTITIMMIIPMIIGQKILPSPVHTFQYISQPQDETMGFRGEFPHSIGIHWDHHWSADFTRTSATRAGPRERTAAPHAFGPATPGFRWGMVKQHKGAAPSRTASNTPGFTT